MELSIRYSKSPLMTGTAMVLAITAFAFGQQKPFTLPGTGQPPVPPAPKAAAPATGTPTAAATAPAADAKPAPSFFNGKIPDAFAKGKINVNARLRYEYVNQEGVAAVTEDSHAPTIRTRFGFTTAPVHGFQGMLEGEDVRILGYTGNYNAAGSNGKAYKPIVADPQTEELNQAWLSYSYKTLISLKAGRQRIVLDNHRFIGDVGWRQNMQTFDAVAGELKPIPELSLYYAYLWDVHRVFGGVAGLPAANGNFDSSSHVVNLSYAPCPLGRLVGYAYLLDLQNGGGAANSSATYGAYFAGTAPLSDSFALGYRAEFAYQTDYAGSALSYETEYYNVELSGAIKPVAFGGGYEVLGSDDGISFRTPLATLHAFNGWADVFLTTPASGLRDIYAFAQVTLPAQIPVRFVYHKYDGDMDGGDFGQEFNVVVSKSFGKHWTALLKYACYMGEDATGAAPLTASNVDVQKFWAQVEFNF